MVGLDIYRHNVGFDDLFGFGAEDSDQVGTDGIQHSRLVGTIRTVNESPAFRGKQREKVVNKRLNCAIRPANIPAPHSFHTERKNFSQAMGKPSFPSLD